MHMTTMRLFSALFNCCLLVLTACTHVPSTTATQMGRFDNSLYVVLTTARGNAVPFIRLYDIDKNKWGKKITIPDSDATVANKMIDNGDLIYLQRHGDWQHTGVVFGIDKKSIVHKAVEIGNFESLSGMDDENFFVTELKYLNEPNNRTYKWLFKGAKYNRNTKTRSEYHFEKYPDLIVTDIWEDNQSYWYACFRGGKPQEYNIPQGILVLVTKSKLDGKLDSYEFDGGNWIFKAKIIGDKDWLWVFREARDVPHNKPPFAKFSKTDKTFVNVSIRTNVSWPITTTNNVTNDDYLWFIDPTFHSRGTATIFRVDKETSNSISIDLPEEIRITGTALVDNEFIWLDAYKLKSYAPSGNTVPYIIKLSKKDLSYDVIYVKPTISDSVKTIFENFFSWLLLPFFKG